MMRKYTAASGRWLVESGAAVPRLPIGNRQSAVSNAFSMVELLVAMTLLSLIVLALMAVFNSTQRAFRASVTQTDILEGSRAALDLMTSDLRTMTPSDGQSNYVYNGFFNPGPVNFIALDNSTANCSYSGAQMLYQPLRQTLPGSAAMRMNTLNYFFALGRNNQNWTGVGYVVNATNAAPMYPLYRFYAETNIAVPPISLYWAFLAAVNGSHWTNLSHVMDGVVHLTVRSYDVNGYLMTNTIQFHGSLEATNRNILFVPPGSSFLIPPGVSSSAWPGSEVGCCFYSNAVPATVELQLGVIEDRTLQRALSLPNLAPAWAQSNYLASQSGHVYLFRQRVTIPNIDPSAYQ